VKAQDGSPTVFLPSVSTKGVRYLQLSYGKVNVVSFVKFSQQKSQQLLKSLDGLAMEYAGCVDMVTVNINKWVEKMFFRLTSLDLPHTRLLQDSGKAKLWSTNNVNESDTVLIFSRTMEPLCVLSLNRDFQSNVSDLVSSVRNRVDEILQQQPLESANLSE
jgi:SUMO ligase MMS21 Smc5/6 complex component